MGYFYKPSGVDVEYQIVDSEGNIIASSRLFKKDELDGNVFAKWGTCSNGFTIRNGICVQEEFTVTLDKDGGTGGTDSYKVKYLNRVGKVNIPLKGGHLFTGYNDESGNQYHNSEGNGVEIYRLTTDSTFTAQWQKCRVGTYTPEGVNRCDECVLGSKSGEGSTSCTPCQGGETTRFM